MYKNIIRNFIINSKVIMTDTDKVKLKVDIDPEEELEIIQSLG
jgi:hypothetical protein